MPELQLHQQVSQLLINYGAIAERVAPGTERYCHCEMHGQHQPCPELVTRLCTILTFGPTTPSALKREDLDRLWQEHEKRQGNYRIPEEWRVALKEAIWAWVCGKQELPKWCKHILWSTSGTIQNHHWYYRDPVEATEVRAGTWATCPLCGQPRPETP